LDRVAIVESKLDRAIEEGAEGPRRLGPEEPLTPGTSLTAKVALELFEDQVRSRVVDVVAREMKARNEGYYTISSAGHEPTAALGTLLRADDPCFLHYRSGALFMARARKAGSDDPVHRTLLSVAASALDPLAEGRHKVWGGLDLAIPPQTSTIASHLPKAVGMAFALGQPDRPDGAAADAIAVCTFGDASVNHASSQTAFNAARWAHRRGRPMPILFVCEDNGIGISVDTPKGWIEATIGRYPGIAYERTSGEIDEVYDACKRAVDLTRSRRRPVFLHLKTVRLWGHAGSDVELGYRGRAAIEASEESDPLVRTVRRMLVTGAASRSQLRAIVDRTRRHARELASQIAGTPRLDDPARIVAPLAPLTPTAIRDRATELPLDDVRRREVAGRRLPEEANQPGARTMAARLNAVLRDELLRRPTTLVFGEDVGRKGGVYGVTAGLQTTFGHRRVFDTLLDETTILGLAQGLGLAGMLPVPEIQYLAYLHNAIDQLRGEACSTGFFSNGAFRTPMVVRIAGLAYQKGFGGHFHNDNSVGALRDIPGLALAVPSRGDDAVRMLRGSLGMADVDGRVVAFLEPIALYHERDLYEPDDGGWLTDYPDQTELLLPGEVGVHGEGDEPLLLVTYGNGVRMSLRAARRLAGDGIRAQVLDLRWLNPLPLAAVEERAREASHVLVVDECRATGGGIADAVLAGLVERNVGRRLGSVRAVDTYIPLGPAADAVLVSENGIVDAARRLVWSE
jgi:2-oxoisovalerate dehydrogenase E1 component